MSAAPGSPTAVRRGVASGRRALAGLVLALPLAGVGVGWLAGAPPAAAAEEAATVDQPRSFGHVVGDVLTQRVLLARAGQAAEPVDLPVADRVGLFLERRAPRLERDESGRRWLAIDYQVINAPRALTALSLPALTLATSAGPLAVAAWPISVGPLTPPETFDRGDLLPLRPDRAVPPLATAGLERGLRAALAVLALVLAAWAAWWVWRNAQDARHLPFARAWRQLRRLDPGSAPAWLALHHALNETAGRTVHGRTLARLLAEAPHLRPHGTQLEAFFRHSEQRFFATSIGATASAFPLRELARALCRAERGQHR